MTNGSSIAVTVLASAGLFAAVVLAVPRRPAGPEATALAAAERPPAAATAPVAAPGTAPDGAAEAAPGIAPGSAPDDAPEAAPSSGPAPAAAAPSFDVVRVEPDGTGLVAGRAEPGEVVSLLAGRAVAGQGEAQQDGRFVIFMDLPASEEARELTLRGADGASSEASVLIGPTAPRADAAPPTGEAAAPEAAPEVPPPSPLPPPPASPGAALAPEGAAPPPEVAGAGPAAPDLPAAAAGSVATATAPAPHGRNPPGRSP